MMNDEGHALTISMCVKFLQYIFFEVFLNLGATPNGNLVPVVIVLNKTWALLHKIMVTLQLMVSLQTMVTTIDFLTLIGYGWSSVAMVVTIDCRDTINCTVTIVLCNGAQGPLHKTYMYH